MIDDACCCTEDFGDAGIVIEEIPSAKIDGEWTDVARLHHVAVEIFLGVHILHTYYYLSKEFQKCGR
eukprot:3540640-Ditylum_brightwellii.AAC.1